MAFGGGGMAGSVGLGFVMTLTDQVSGPAGAIGKSISMLHMGMSKLGQGFAIVGAGMAGFGGGIAASLVDGVKQAAKFETTLKTIQGIAGDAFSDEDIKAMSYRIDSLTSQLPMSSQEMAEAMQQAAQLGLTLGKSGEDALKTLERIGFESAQLSAITGDMTAGQALYGLSAGLKQFGLDIAENAGAYSDAMVAVRNSTSATVPYLMEVASRSAGTAKSFGLTAAQFTGISGVIADVVKQPQGAASGLSMIFNAMLQRSEKFGKLLGMNVQQYQDLANQKPVELFQAIVAKLATLDKFSRANMFKELGLSGRFATRVMDGLLAANNEMIDGQTRLARVLGITDSAWESGLNRGEKTNSFYEKMSQTAVNLFKTFQGNIDNIKKQVGTELLEAIKPALAALVMVQSALLTVAPEQKRVLAIVLAIVAAVSVLAGTLLMVTSVFFLFGSVLVPALLVTLPLVLAIAGGLALVYGAIMAFKGEGQSAFEFLAQGAEKVISALSSFIGVLRGVFIGMKNHMLEPFQEAKVVLLDTMSILGDFFPEMEGLDDIAGSLGNTVGKALVGAIRKVGFVVKQAAVLFRGFLLSLQRGDYDDFISSMRTLWSVLSTVVSLLAKPILANWAATLAVVKGLVEGIAWAWWMIGPAIESILVQVDTLFDLVGLRSEEAMGKTFSAVGLLQGAFTVIGAILGAIIGSIAVAINAVAFLVVLIVSLVQSSVQILDFFYSLGQGIAQAIVPIVEYIGLWMQQFFAKVGADVFALAMTPIRALVGLLNKVPGLGETLGLSGFEAEFAKVKDGIAQDFAKSIVPESEFKEAGEKISEAFMTPMEGQVRDIFEPLAKMGTGAAAFGESLKDVVTPAVKRPPLGAQFGPPPPPGGVPVPRVSPAVGPVQGPPPPPAGGVPGPGDMGALNAAGTNLQGAGTALTGAATSMGAAAERAPSGAELVGALSNARVDAQITTNASIRVNGRLSGPIRATFPGFGSSIKGMIRGLVRTEVKRQIVTSGSS